jgi:hypothetical protein
VLQQCTCMNIYKKHLYVHKYFKTKLNYIVEWNQCQAITHLLKAKQATKKTFIQARMSSIHNENKSKIQFLVADKIWQFKLYYLPKLNETINRHPS